MNLVQTIFNTIVLASVTTAGTYAQLVRNPQTIDMSITCVLNARDSEIGDPKMTILANDYRKGWVDCVYRFWLERNADFAINFDDVGIGDVLRESSVPSDVLFRSGHFSAQQLESQINGFENCKRLLRNLVTEHGEKTVRENLVIRFLDTPDTTFRMSSTSDMADLRKRGLE